MKTREYIESGILELYAANALSAQEADEVLQKIEKYPELRIELDEIEKAIEMYAGTQSVTVSETAKSALFGKIEKTSSTNSQKTTISGMFPKLMAASFVGIAILLSGIALYFYVKLNRAEERISLLEKQNNVLTINAVRLEKQQSETSSYLSILRDPQLVKVEMKGLALSPASSVMVYWKATTKEVYVDVRSLPVAPDGKQYQLWALKDGKPIDAGVFETSDNYSGIQKMKMIQDAQAFAVTLEKTGGSATPTLEAMYVMGTL